jgi:cytochrome P450
MDLKSSSGMSRDEKVYQQPNEFKPERFLPTPEGNNEPYFDPSWGFGRRYVLVH